MRKFISSVILIPLAAILIAFAVANRHFVTVSVDPFNSADRALSVSIPLFALIIAAGIAGVLAGGCATWLEQGYWRRAARRHEADARELRAELGKLRAATHRETFSVPQVPRGGFFAPGGRDKRGATL